MLPYWIFFGIFAVAALTARPDVRLGSKAELLLFGLPILIFMIGLRYYVGVDYANYLRAWNLADNMSLVRFYEARPGDPIFYTIVWVMKNLGWPYWSLNLFCGAIFSVGLVHFARQQPNGWLGIAVAIPYLVIVIAMSGIRQATAMGFIFLALVSFRRASTKGFIGWTVVAAMFHASAIVVLPFAGLSFARNRLQSALLMAITLAGGYFVLGSAFGEYSKDYMGRYASDSAGTAYRIAMSFFPAILYLWLSRRMPFLEREKSLWRNFALLSVASVPLLFVVQSTTALDRLLLYAFPLQMMMLAWLPYFFDKSGQRLAVVTAILGYLALQLFVFLTYAVNARDFLPYQNVIFGGSSTIATEFAFLLLCFMAAMVARGSSPPARIREPQPQAPETGTARSRGSQPKIREM